MDGGSIQSKFSDLKGVRDGGQLCFREPLDIGGRHREGSIIRGAYEKQSKTKHSGVQQLEVPSNKLGTTWLHLRYHKEGLSRHLC